MVIPMGFQQFIGIFNRTILVVLGVKTHASYVVSSFMLCVFDSSHLIPQISFVRNPSNSFYSILFSRSHPFSLG